MSGTPGADSTAMPNPDAQPPSATSTTAPTPSSTNNPTYNTTSQGFPAISIRSFDSAQYSPQQNIITSSVKKPSDPKSTLLPLLIRANCLSFGRFTLKSGRISPYFFTSSHLHTASLSRAVADAYADVLCRPPFSLLTSEYRPGSFANPHTKPIPQFDVLFGPAYKGIPLVSAIATSSQFTSLPPPHEISWSFNRKESKSHGEGGTIVGAPLHSKRVVIIDDVLTAGTALREAVSIIRAQGGTVVGVVLLLDRQERVSETESRSAMKVAQDDLKVPVASVLKFEDILGCVESGEIGEAQGVGEGELRELREYRERYGSV